MNRRLLTGAVLTAGVLAAGILYFLFDPADSVLAPKCAFKAMTGWDCPGCGSQRMVHALLHGDLTTAWNANPVVLCMLPLILVMAAAAATRTRAPRFYAAVNSVPVIIVTAALLLGWGIVRNLQ